MSWRKALQKSTNTEVDQFIDALNKQPVKFTGGGRLLFALDATASRQPTWDRACHLQSEMFQACHTSSPLLLQLCYFKGYRGFFNTPWLSDSDTLLKTMNQVTCEAGHTQITRVLTHARQENARSDLNAVVFIGDSMEEQHNELCRIAGELGLFQVPVFMFQEGNDLITRKTFKAVAELSGGAYLQLNQNSAKLLQQLLAAVAVYATQGRAGLEHLTEKNPEAVVPLLKQIK